MHPDLERLARADELDRARRKAQSTLEAERAAHQAAEQAVAARQQALDALDAELAEAREGEHALNRKLHLYRQRRESALRVLEGGGGDPASAERQLSQCDQILDTTETETLELMEKQDELQAKRAEAEAALAADREALAASADALPGKVAHLEAELAQLTREREQVVGSLDPHLRDRYEQLVRRKGTAVASIEGGACKACRMVVQPQHITDLKRGIITPCRGCNRWLVP